MEYLPVILSVISLGLSLFTLWLTSFNRGTIKCTRPSFIALKYDFVGKEHPQAKIFLRTLLFSTGKRGNVIENLFLRVKEKNNVEEFSFWGYGDTNLIRGSGLYVGENGIATYHHFNPVNAEKLFVFKKEKFEIELIAKIIGKKRLVTLAKFALIVPSEIFEKHISQNDAIYFNWSDEQKNTLWRWKVENKRD